MRESGFDMTLGVQHGEPQMSAFRIRNFRAEPLQTGGKLPVLEHFLPLSLPETLTNHPILRTCAGEPSSKSVTPNRYSGTFPVPV